jgi:hypothetical protein
MKPIDLTQALKDLGKTSDKVYQTLKSKGIKGVSCVAWHCPIAHYLESLTGQKMSVGLRNCGYSGNRGRTDVELPMPVQLFIRRFDDGLFPDMVE